MKLMKIWAVAIVAALAMTAVAGAGTASAGSSFSADDYPAKFEAEGSAVLTAFGTSSLCKTGFQAEATGDVETIVATPFGSCETFGFPHKIQRNGCQLEFHSGLEDYYGEFHGSFDVGPPGCGPMTVNQSGSCVLSIGSQTGLDAVYRNVTFGGATPAVEIALRVENLQVTRSGGPGCAGSTSSGKLTGSLQVLASSEGQTTGVRVEDQPHAPAFEAPEYPVALAGTQDPASKQVLSLDGSTVACETVNSSGELSAASTQAQVSPAYGGCTVFGFSGGTVKTNGCSFTYNVTGVAGGGGFSGSQALVCPPGQSLEVSAYTCSASIPAQSFGAGVYQNIQSGSQDAVALPTDATGLTYTVSKDGFLCPLAGLGTRANGSYKGTTILKASAAGEPSDLRIGT